MTASSLLGHLVCTWHVCTNNRSERAAGAYHMQSCSCVSLPPSSPGETHLGVRLVSQSRTQARLGSFGLETQPRLCPSSPLSPILGRGWAEWGPGARPPCVTLDKVFYLFELQCP